LGDFAVVVFGDFGDGDAQAEETGVDVAEGFFDWRVLEEICMDDGAEFRMGVGEWAANYGADFVYDGCGEAGFEDAVACGTGCAEEEDFHRGSEYTGF
jgi:hypothetical protein